MLHFFLFPLRPRMLRSFENDRKSVSYAYRCILMKLRKISFVFTQFFCRNKKFRLIDDSKAQFENDVAENLQSCFFLVTAARAASAHLFAFDVEKRSLFVSFSRIFWQSLLEFSTLLAHVVAQRRKKKFRVTLTAHANYLISDVFSDAITQYKRVKLKYIRFGRMGCGNSKTVFYDLHFFSLAYSLLHAMRANQNCGMNARHVQLKSI